MLGGFALSAQAPASVRYRSGSMPVLSPTALGGGQVFLELSISPDGGVTSVTPIRTTPPFTDLVASAVRDWRFDPASGPATPVETRVLVAAVFRAPVLMGPTLGERPRDIAAASASVALPAATAEPPFPAQARDAGVVLVEVLIAQNGRVDRARVVHSSPPFDDVAVAAAQRWTFRPARVGDTPVASVAYIIFGFPVPLGSTPRGRGMLTPRQ